MPRTGRPSKYTQEIVDEICHRISEGETLTQICNDDHLPTRATVIRWTQATQGTTPEQAEDFRSALIRARADQAYSWADEIVKIAADDSKDIYEVEMSDKNGRTWTESRVSHAAVQRSKLRIDTYQWLMARFSEHFIERAKRELSGPNNQPITPVINVTIESAKDGPSSSGNSGGTDQT